MIRYDNGTIDRCEMNWRNGVLYIFLLCLAAGLTANPVSAQTRVGEAAVARYGRPRIGSGRENGGKPHVLCSFEGRENRENFCVGAKGGLCTDGTQEMQNAVVSGQWPVVGSTCVWSQESSRRLNPSGEALMAPQ